MSKKLLAKLRRVRNGVNAKLAAGHSDLGFYGKGLQREGWEGGYLQALTDIEAYLSGWSDCNSRHQALWEAGEIGR